MVGAMDSFGERKALLAIMPMIMDQAAKKAAISAVGQVDLFDSALNDSKQREVTASPLPQVEPATSSAKVQWEKELLGVFLTSHPLEKYFWVNITGGFQTIESVKNLPRRDQSEGGSDRGRAKSYPYQER
jgi:DNA polymerase-3 subunit alpha